MTAALQPQSYEGTNGKQQRIDSTTKHYVFSIFLTKAREGWL